MRAAALGLVLAAVASVASASSRVERFTLDLSGGRTLNVQLRLPINAEPPFAVAMLFGGFRRGSEALDLVETDRPLAWANFEYPYDPPRKFRFPSSLFHAPQMRDAIHGTFEGVVKLHETLRQRPDIDGERISVVGASAGAPIAVVGAARGGIPGVILVQGFADVPDVIVNIVARKHREKYGDWILWPARWFARWVTWYCEIPDIAAQARRLQAHQRVLLVTAEEDDYVPRPASDSLWRALEASDSRAERIIQRGRHLRADKEGEVEKILEPALEWMERHELL